MLEVWQGSDAGQPRKLVLTQELQWHKLIPIDQHCKFLAGERKYCALEEKAFCVTGTETLRQYVLEKRDEYLLYYLQNELV